MGSAARSMKRRALVAAKKAEDKERRSQRQKQRGRLVAPRRVPMTPQERLRRARAAQIALGVGSRLAPGSVVIGPDGKRQPMAAVPEPSEEALRQTAEHVENHPPFAEPEKPAEPEEQSP